MYGYLVIVDLDLHKSSNYYSSHDKWSKKYQVLEIRYDSTLHVSREDADIR